MGTTGKRVAARVLPVSASAELPEAMGLTRDAIGGAA